MADRLRVYHPETGEPFDLPVKQANELRLQQGWLSQPLDPNAVPAVQTVAAVEEAEKLFDALDEDRETLDELNERKTGPKKKNR